MDLGLKSKSVLVTAASKGIGKAIAEQFVEEGCKVMICSRDKENLIKTSEEIGKKLGVEPSWCICDLNKSEDIANTFEAVKEQNDTLDILVNNCGGPPPGILSEIDEEDWNRGYEQVLLSAVRFTKKALTIMKEKEWGRIINVTSVSVKQPVDNLLLSNVFRTGLVSFAKTVSNQVAKHNITINNVAPGYTLTHRLYELAVQRAKNTDKSHEDVLTEMAKEIPINRLAGPEEIASAVLFLASKQASYITGNTIHVDGGLVKGYY